MVAAVSEVERTSSDSVEALPDTSVGVEEESSGADGLEKNGALEVPAPMRGTPERILKRTGFEESYNAATRIPNWVAWHLTAAHTDGPIQRKDYDFTDDESVPDPKEYDADYHHSGWTHGHMCLVKEWLTVSR